MRPVKTIKTPAILTASLALAALSASAGDDIPLFKPKTSSVAVFKNGISFVTRNGIAPTKDGWTRLDELPPAALGSLWIGAVAEAGPITDVIAYREKVFEEADPVSQDELLAANIGKRAVISHNAGATVARIEGVILSAPGPRKPDDAELFPEPDAYHPYRGPVEPVRPEIVLVRGAGGNGPFVVSINRASIQSVDFLETPNLKTRIEREVGRAKVRLEGHAKSPDLTLSYLEKGIIWSPGYRVNVEDPKMADISLEAVLADDAEDLENVEVAFVVGYPNFFYSDTLSPISVRQSVASFIRSLSAGRPAGAYSSFANTMSQAAFNSPYASPQKSESSYSVTQPLQGEGNEDLYFYKKSGVSLKKGDRARYEIFHASVPYEHVYEWTVPDTMGVDERGYLRPDQSGRGKETVNQVWHVLRIENKTKQPWTTAPAFALKGAMPLAQDLIGYTPSGEKATLRLTVASDLRTEQTQTESARKQVNLSNRSFEEVVVDAKFKVTNFKSEEVCVFVHKTIEGEVLSAGDGKVTKVARKLSSFNPTTDIEWEFHLAPGKSIDLTCQSKTLVSR
jgi:hypothetical protein